MPNIYIADTTDYIVATTSEQAASAYTLIRSKDATSLTKTVDTVNVIVAVENYTFTAIADPAPAIGDAFVYPAAGTVKAGSDQVFTAIPGSTYVTFVNWVDETDTEISTANPAVINIDENAKAIKAVFTT